VTAFAKNPVGLLLQDLIFQGGVGSALISWVDYDGVGRKVRNGSNFTERGFAVRPALGCSDRGHAVVPAIKPGENAKFASLEYKYHEKSPESHDIYRVRDAIGVGSVTALRGGKAIKVAAAKEPKLRFVASGTCLAFSLGV
jgi:hypothetical protein